MPTADRPTTQKLHWNLGDGLLKIGEHYRRFNVNPEMAMGETMDGLVSAALKAVLPGRQSSKQVADLQQRARQAVSRKIARQVKKLRASA